MVVTDIKNTSHVKTQNLVQKLVPTSLLIAFNKSIAITTIV